MKVAWAFDSGRGIAYRLYRGPRCSACRWRIDPMLRCETFTVA
jgi:hypothetical protein